MTDVDRIILAHRRNKEWRLFLEDIPEEHREQVLRRLKALETLYMAAPGGAGSWRIEPRFDQLLLKLDRQQR